MNHVVLYVSYLVLSIGVTIWVASTLARNGQIFLVAIFRGDVPLATAVNHLLVVGFYLINIGFVAHALYEGGRVEEWQRVIEVLSRKVGTVLMVLAGIHFFNMFILFRMRRRAGTTKSAAVVVPPVPPADPVAVRVPGR